MGDKLMLDYQLLYQSENMAPHDPADVGRRGARLERYWATTCEGCWAEGIAWHGTVYALCDDHPKRIDSVRYEDYAE